MPSPRRAAVRPTKTGARLAARECSAAPCVGLQPDTRIIREPAATVSTGDGVRIGNFYRSFMDEARIEGLGDQPLQADRDRVRGLQVASSFRCHVRCFQRLLSPRW